MNSISFLAVGVVVDLEELIYFIFVVKFKCVKLFRIIFWTPAMPVVISPDICNVCSNMFCIIPDAGNLYLKKKKNPSCWQFANFIYLFKKISSPLHWFSLFSCSITLNSALIYIISFLQLLLVYFAFIFLSSLHKNLDLWFESSSFLMCA